MSNKSTISSRTTINLALALCLFTYDATSQGKIPSIFFVDSVPLIIQCDTFIDSLEVRGENINIISILSESLTVLRPAPNNGTTSTTMLRNGLSLRPADLQKVEYRSLFNNQIKFGWKALKQMEKAILPNPAELATAEINGMDSLQLDFRYIDTKKHIQSVIFKKAVIRPLIVASRIIKSSDRTDETMEAMAVRGREGIPKGFGSPIINNLILPPNTCLELIMDKQNTSSDSLLLYRLLSNDREGETAWKRSGHFVKVKDMEPDTDYVLEIKYVGLDMIFSFEIQVLPYWYQTKTAMLLFIGIGLIIFLAARLSWSIYKLRKERRTKIKAQEQLTVLQNKLNPHFISNALSSIQDLMNDNKIDEANLYLSRFSSMMRGTLGNSSKHFIPLSEELKMLEKYLTMEQLRFGFRFKISVSPKVDTQKTRFPPMLLQPTVENSVIHGVQGMDETGYIEIIVDQQRGGLEITVKDNGAKKRREPSTDRDHNGIKLTKARMENLNKLSKNAKAEYKYMREEKGCTVVFLLENLNLTEDESNNNR